MPPNVDNLKKGKEYRFSGQRAVEMGRKGGQAMHKKAKLKKTMREIAIQIAAADVSDKNKATLQNLGVEDDSMTNSALVTASIFKEAVNGNMKAIDKWERLIDSAKAEEEKYELPARVIGRAFVDANRNIQPNKKYVFKGGRAGLKSSFVSLKIIEIIKNNPDLHGCIVRKVASTLKDSVYAQLTWAIKELNIEEEFEFKKNPLEIVYKKTGQTLYFRGADDPVKLKSIKPPFGYLGILWKEEWDQLGGQEEDRSINQSVLRGGPLSYEFCSFNPPKTTQAWVNKELKIPDENRIVHTSTYLDAPVEWLGQKFIDDAEHLKEVNPRAYEHEYMGEANGEGGAVFDMLEFRDITDKEIATFDRIYQGVDWGFYPDPYAFVRLHYDADSETIYLIDEYVVNKQRNVATGEEIIRRGYDDYEITCDSAEKKSVADYKDMGLRAKPAIKGPGSVDYGMKWMQVRKIVIDYRRTPRAAEEFGNYEYDRDKNDNVISGYPDANNHTIDAVRYALEKFWTKRGNQA